MRMRVAIVGSLAFLTVVVQSSLGAPSLQVDIGREGGQRVAAGWAEASVGDSMGSDFTASYPRSDNGQTVSVTLAADSYIGLVDAGGRNQDAGENQLPLDRVIEDFMKVDQDRLTVRLGGFAAGLYDIVSYHNAPATGFNFSQNFRIEGKDAANATFATLLDGKATSTTSDPAAATTAEFTLVSDGVNPMEFRLVSNVLWGNEQPPERAGHPTNVLLNGFGVSVVPEPTSMAAVILTGLLAVLPRRRR